MNRNAYRRVYSRLRGMVMAVSETASAVGKSASGTARAQRRASRRLAPVAMLAASAAAGLAPGGAQAQISGAGPHAPQVVRTPNGLPQVNINRPGGAGVSINTYNRFDVQRAGAILNNSATMVDTRQAGWINGNPNFGPNDAARIIVNQVNSPNPSQIRGALEIAGARAELVLANPSGIYLDGAGFINTSRATLTTGAPFYGPDGSLAGYQVDRGLVTVAGAGLNAATDTDQVDIIARAVKVNTALYARRLDVVAGANRVEHDTLAATPTGGSGEAPAVAIDVAQLGGMYADRMFLVGNSAGVGVANAGTIEARAGDLHLQSDGRLVLTGQTNASGSMTLSAAGGVQNDGTTYAKQSVTLDTDADLSNDGKLAAWQDVTVTAGSVASAGSLGAGLDDAGAVANGGALKVTAQGRLTSTGVVTAGGDATLRGADAKFAGHTVADGALSFAATRGDLDLSNGTTSAGHTLSVNAAGTVRNDHGSLSSGGVATLAGGALSNHGGKVSSRGALSVKTTGRLDNDDGELASKRTVELHGAALTNRRGLVEGAAGTTVAGASLDNTAGRIASLNGDGMKVAIDGRLVNAPGTTAGGAPGGVITGNGDVSVQGGEVINRGTVTAARDLDVTGGSADNDGGSLRAVRKLTLDSGTHLSNAGGAIIGQTAQLSGTTLDNSGGTVQADQVALDAERLINHGGTITQTGSDATHIDVTGKIDNTDGGKLETNSADLKLTAAELDNSGGTIKHGGAGTLTLGASGSTVHNVGGEVTSEGRVLAQASEFDNSRGTVSGKRGLQAMVGGTLENTAGRLLSNGALDIGATTLTNDADGLIDTLAGGTLHVDTLHNSGQITAGQAAGIHAKSLGNDGGTIQAAQLDLSADDLSNQGGMITQTGTAAMRVDVSGTLDNSRHGEIQTRATDLKLAPAQLVNDGGTLRHLGAGTLTLGDGASKINNVGGAILGNGAVDVRASGFDNTGGDVSGHGGLTAEIGGQLDNRHGQLISDAALGLTSTSLKNDGGTLGAGTRMTLRSDSISNRGGTISAPELAATVKALLDNDAGNLEANQLALKAWNLSNRGGTISQWHDAPISIEVSGRIDNSHGGLFQTNSADFTLDPAELDNAGGTLTHGGAGTLTLTPGEGASTLDNASGTIVTAGRAVVRAGDWNNASGIFSAARDIDAKLAGGVDNTKGLLLANTGLAFASDGALVNRGGHLQAGRAGAADGSLDVRAASIDNADGAIVDLGTGKTSVHGGSQIANSQAGGVADTGIITGNGDVTVEAAAIDNTEGGQISGAALHVRGDTLDNRGGYISNIATAHGDADVTIAGAITNTHGQIGSTHDLTLSAVTLQGGGQYGARHDAMLHLGGDYTTSADTHFEVGHDLGFTLPGTFTNRSTLQSVNDLGIEAGNVVNSGAITAGGLLHTKSSSLTNSGALVGASTSLEATDTVSNLGPTALIGGSDRNGTLKILAKHIENRDDTTIGDTMAQTAIFGMGKVVLAGGKDAGGHYTNAGSVNNASALIQSGSDMELHADKVTNTRRVMRTSSGAIDPAVLSKFGVPIEGRTGSVGVMDPNSIGGVYTDPPHEEQWNSTYQYTTYRADSATATTVTGLSPAAQIVSGGGIDTSSVGAVKNYWSHIAAVGNMAMPRDYDSDGWAASGQPAPKVDVSYSGQYHYNNYDNTEHDWQLPFGNAPFVTGRPGGYAQAAPADVKSYRLPGYDATLDSNGKITGTGVDIHNTAANAALPSLGLLPGQAVPGLTSGPVSGSTIGSRAADGAGAISGVVGTTGAQSVTVRGKRFEPVPPAIASATAVDVLTHLSIPQGGLYRPTTVPGASYVIETNPAFTSQQRFLSSDYFFDQIGVDLTHIPKRLGDGFYEQQLVRNEITSLTGKAVLGPYADTQQMYQGMMQAGASLSKSLDLPIGASLSADQVSKLTGNVVMMETRVVDGQSVLVPVVYLAKGSQANWDGPLIRAGGVDLKDTKAFENSGTIQADETLAIQGRQIDNAFGALRSGGLMSLKTRNDIDLTSANVKAGSLALDAGKKLILDTAARTERRVSRDGATSVVTTLGPIASLDVAGDAAIVTGGDFRQNAGNLDVGGALGMQVGGDWDLGAVRTGEHKIVQRANGVSDTDVNTMTGSTVTVGGVSNIAVGGDLTAHGARLSLGQGGTVATKGNLSLDVASATTEVHSNDSGDQGSRSYASSRHTLDQALTGTTLESGDALNLLSGGNIAARGSTIHLDKGRASLAAAGDVEIDAASEQHEFHTQGRFSHGMVVSSSNVASGIDETATYNQGSTISADAVGITSGRNIHVGGSNIVGTDGVSMKAARHIDITTSQDTVRSSSYYDKREAGLLSNGGLSFSIGSRSMSDRQQAESVTNHGSAIGALNGNLTIEAGDTVHATGSILHAGRDTLVTGKKIMLDAAQDTGNQAEQQQYRQSGVTLGVTNPVVAMVQTATQMVNAAQSVGGDPRLVALAAATTGLAAKNTYDALKSAGGDPVKAATSVGINISVGASKSDSQMQGQSSTALVTGVSAGRNMVIKATGAGEDSNIDAIGSTISAGNDTTLHADGKVNLQAAQNTSSLHSNDSGASAGLGVSIGVGSQSGIAFTASASGNRGHATGDSTTWTNTQVVAGHKFTLESGGDTNLNGAVVSGQQVVGKIGGKLNVESLQDLDHYDSKQQGAGFGVSLCVPPLCAGNSSVTASIDQMKMRSHYAAVGEQSGIRAGDGGFQIDVKGVTHLKGGVIASSDKAMRDGVNRLTTAALTHEDIQNHAAYDASKVALSGGYSFGGSSNKNDDKDKSGQTRRTSSIGRDQKGRVDNVNPVPTTSMPSEGGFVAAPPVVLGASGNADTTTRSAISGGEIRITDEAAQQRLTGQTGTEAVASINRDTSDTGGALAPIFDKDKIRAGFDIAGQFINQVGTFVANKTNEIDVLREKAGDPKAKDADGNPLTEVQRQQMLAQADEVERTWGPGKPGRQVLTALAAAAGGNVTGGAGQFAANATIGYVQGLAANKVKALADSLGRGTPEAESARAALHAIVGCAGVAASSQSCGAGAMGAAASSLIGSMLGSTQGLTEQERQARVDLVSSVVVGIAASGGLDATSAGTAAKIEGENNQVAPLLPLPGMGMAGGASQDLPPGIPGYKGEERRKGDSVIADPATELDSEAKAGALVTPSPGPAAVEALITASPPAKIKQLVEAVLNAVSSKSAPVPDALPGRKTKGKTTQWEKSGGMNEANRDFDYLNPEYVEVRDDGGRIGKLGDGRIVIVRPKSSDGRPTLEIQDGKRREKVRYGK
ncbi:hemagglutinin repeat-containing protein [Burkholderia plantarii]|uniref:two-partner secretion domain-containing protein n=1 Tax=Burkholderia plantarii TaxID=41899 RepID=UPI003F72BEE7|nr:hemagglutinin repeat-containing protein [Burkholderia plantarii]